MMVRMSEVVRCRSWVKSGVWGSLLGNLILLDFLQGSLFTQDSVRDVSHSVYR
jgi:hypothetical protein